MDQSLCQAIDRIELPHHSKQIAFGGHNFADDFASDRGLVQLSVGWRFRPVRGESQTRLNSIPPKGSLFERCDACPKLGEHAIVHVGIQWNKRADGLPRTAPRTDVVANISKPGFARGVEKMAGNLTQFGLKKIQFLSLRPEHLWPRATAWKLSWSDPKIVCNRSRFERKSPWRIAAFADLEGLVFTQQFCAVWTEKEVSKLAVAAVLSSPIASAFSFERDLDRDNHISTLLALPIPKLEYLSASSFLHHQAKKLQSLLTPRDFVQQSSEEEINEALLRLDAAVLEAYDLPARVQRQLLNQFQGWKRPVAVPFTGYFPDHFKDAITLKDFVAIQFNWDETNERRCDLIEKELSRAGLKADEQIELEHLQHLADLLVRLKAPYPLEELGGLVAELKAKGKWKPST